MFHFLLVIITDVPQYVRQLTAFFAAADHLHYALGQQPAARQRRGDLFTLFDCHEHLVPHFLENRITGDIGRDADRIQHRYAGVYQLAHRLQAARDIEAAAELLEDGQSELGTVPPYPAPFGIDDP